MAVFVTGASLSLFHSLYLIRHPDAYYGFLTDYPCHHDRRIDDFPDCAIHFHQNCPSFIQNTKWSPSNFLAFSLGFTLGGVLFEKGYHAGNDIGFYQLLFYIGAATGTLLLLLIPVLNKMLKGID